MFWITVTFGVFAEVQPLSASVAITETQVTDQIDIQLAPEDSIDIKTCSSGQLHTLLFSPTCDAYDLAYVLNDGTTDSADSLTLDEPQFFTAGNLGAIEVNPTQVKLTKALPAEATTEVFSLRKRQHRRLIYSWYPVLGKLSKHTKRSVDTAGQIFSLIQSQRIFSAIAIQASQLLFKSYA